MSKRIAKLCKNPKQARLIGFISTNTTTYSSSGAKKLSKILVNVLLVHLPLKPKLAHWRPKHMLIKNDKSQFFINFCLIFSSFLPLLFFATHFVEKNSANEKRVRGQCPFRTIGCYGPVIVTRTLQRNLFPTTFVGQFWVITA